MTASDNGDTTEAVGLRGRRLRLSHMVALVIVGLILVFAAGVTAVILWNRESATQATLADLAAAEARWQRRGPSSYVLDLQTTGRRNDRYHLEVRDGVSTVFKVNGQVPKKAHVFESWTVPHQFQYIRDDMTRAAGAGTSPVIHVEFDAETGLPRHYRFSGAGESRGWDVQRFESDP